MLCALVMAGGKGTRFWPLSTEEKPKQFLKLLENRTMLQMTVDRIRGIIPIERIFVCTNKQYVNYVKEQLKDLPSTNIIVEPESKNTAPCITLSAFIIRRYYKNANMIVLPSDHLIEKENEFINIIYKANVFLNANKEAIVTLGITPTRAETGYGYIKCGSIFKEVEGKRIIKANSFVEKPNKDKASLYIKTGKYLWNCGIFIWNIDNLINKIKLNCKKMYNLLKDIEFINCKYMEEFIKDKYKKLDSISIDYALLEKVENIYVIPSNIGWDDVGSWEAVERYGNKDIKGNISVGRANFLQSKNNIIYSQNNSVTLKDMEDIYVIECNGKIMIGKKENIVDIKELQ